MSKVSVCIRWRDTRCACEHCVRDGYVKAPINQREAPILQSGYTDCACRDCFDVAIGTPGSAICHDCAAAECSPDGNAECQRSDAYGCGEADSE